MNSYLQFIGRRERIVSSIWLLSIVLSVALFATLYPPLIPTHTEKVALALSMQNPAMVAMMGPVYGVENLSQASVMAQQTLIWFLIAVALMNIFLINRHSRIDEEQGSQELLRALPINKREFTLSVLLFALGLNLAIGVLSACALNIVNIEGTTLLGSLLFGLAITWVGFFFASLTLLLAQLFHTGTAVNTAALTLLALSYIVRAIGDVGNSTLSYFSPLGLALSTHLFYANHLTPLVLLALQSLIMGIIALCLGVKRDYGSGLLPQRKRETTASKSVTSVGRLAWRLSYQSLIAWAVGIFLLALSYGSVITELATFVENNELMRKIIETGGSSTLLDGYIALIYALMTPLCSVPMILISLRIYGEERRGRVELLFTKPIRRLSLYRKFLLITFVEGIVMLLLLAIGLYVPATSLLSLSKLILIGFSYLPAMWFITSVGVALVGLIPRLSSFVWLYIGSTFLIMYMGEITNLPKWISYLSPFSAVAKLPVEKFTIAPLIYLSFGSFLFITVGFYGYRKRDIT